MSSNSLLCHAKVVVFCFAELDKTSFLTTTYQPDRLTELTPPTGADHLYLLSIPYHRQQLQIEFCFLHIKEVFKYPVTADQIAIMENARYGIGVFDQANA